MNVTLDMDGLQGDSTSAAKLENDNSQGESQKADVKQLQCPEDKEKANMDARIIEIVMRRNNLIARF